MSDPTGQTITQSEVEARLRHAIDLFNQHERSLLEVDANERSLTAKFAAYLQSAFPQWDVDCEYNRDGHDAKRLQLRVEQVATNDDEAHTVFPDIIVHRRGRRSNLLVIEAKKSHAVRRGLNDLVKLRAYLSQMGYQFAVALTIYTGDSQGIGPPDFIRPMTE